MSNLARCFATGALVGAVVAGLAVLVSGMLSPPARADIRSRAATTLDAAVPWPDGAYVYRGQRDYCGCLLLERDGTIHHGTEGPMTTDRSRDLAPEPGLDRDALSRTAAKLVAKCSPSEERSAAQDVVNIAIEHAETCQECKPASACEAARVLRAHVHEMAGALGVGARS